MDENSGWLQWKADVYKYGVNGLAETINLFLSDVPDAKLLREWMMKNARKGIGEIVRDRGQFKIEDWEFELWSFAFTFVDFRGLTGWEVAPEKERKGHIDRVVKLATELAKELERDDLPYYPPILELFSDESALDIIRRLDKDVGKHAISCTGYSLEFTDYSSRYKRDANIKNCLGLVKEDYATGFNDVIDKEYPVTGNDGEVRYPVYCKPSRGLSGVLLGGSIQRISPVLRNLADYADRLRREERRDKRPLTGEADARVFARYISDHFHRFFGRTPNDVIAACVCLKFQELEEPPNGDTIRAWRGVR